MNIANKLTFFRIFIIPFMIAAMLYNYYEVALILFLLATVTDFLDGYLARKLNIQTNLGKFIDPLADKLLVLSALAVFVEIGSLSSVILIIVLSRELIISIFRAVASSQGVVISAAMLGKIKTNFQFFMTVYLFVESISYKYYFELPFGDIPKMFLIISTVVFTVLSGVEYIIKNRKVLN